MESNSELSLVQKVLIELLKIVSLSETNIIGLMLTLKDDEEAMKDLVGYLHYDKATKDEVMNVWIPNYLRAHPQNTSPQP